MEPSTLTIIILILAVISFLLEKIPVNMTVMLTMCALVLTGLVTPQEAVSGFASTTILMLIGVVIVGSALFETGVCDKVAAVVTRYAKTERSKERRQASRSRDDHIRRKERLFSGLAGVSGLIRQMLRTK